MQPSEILIANEGELLVIVLDAGRRLEIAAHVLWESCPSALRRRQRLSNHPIVAPPGVRVVQARQIGNYALNIAFSDGHDRGVYPWTLLAELALRPQISDFLIPAPDAACAGTLATALR